jgi:hypothetical protein
MQSGDKMTKPTKLSTNKLTNPQECPICHKVGFHKLSCTKNNAKIVIPMAVIPKIEADDSIGQT